MRLLGGTDVCGALAHILLPPFSPPALRSGLGGNDIIYQLSTR